MRIRPHRLLVVRVPKADNYHRPISGLKILAVIRRSHGTNEPHHDWHSAPDARLFPGNATERVTFMGAVDAADVAADTASTTAIGGVISSESAKEYRLRRYFCFKIKNIAARCSVTIKSIIN